MRSLPTRKHSPPDDTSHCEESCPAPEPGGDMARCPVSLALGPRVELVTLKALLKGEALRRLEGKEYRFCPDPRCEVVYFDRSADSSFRKEDLQVRVGLKESEDPVPVCYCFHYTAADLRRDIMERGETDVPAAIAAEIREGHCACEVKNPKGACCLWDVRSAVKRIRSEVRSGHAPI